MGTYDGTTGLRQALETLLGKTLSADAMSDITRPYKVAKGLPADTKLTGKDYTKLRLEIYTSEAKKLLTTSHETVAEPTQTETTSVEEEKSKTNPATIKGVEAKRFNVKMPDNNYKAVYLEPEFVTALNIIEPDRKKQLGWLRNAVVNIGDRNPAGGIRGAIVTELLTRNSLVSELDRAVELSGGWVTRE